MAKKYPPNYYCYFILCERVLYVCVFSVWPGHEGSGRDIKGRPDQSSQPTHSTSQTEKERTAMFLVYNKYIE